MKMINKDVLVTEIEKKRDAALTRQRNLEAIGQVTVLNELIANELNRIITFINTLEVKEVDLEKEAGYSKPASKDFTFKSIPRILEMVKPSERAKSYCEKLAKSLEDEGYLTDAKIVRESIKMMNGEKVPMATMGEESYWKELRNRAAIAAMKGTITILGSSDRNAFREIVVEGFKGDKKCLTTYPNEISQFAIACADALIKELKK